MVGGRKVSVVFQENQQTVKKSVTINAENESISTSSGSFNTILNGQNPFSISIWIKPTNISDAGTLFSNIVNDSVQYDGIGLFNRGQSNANIFRVYMVDDFSLGSYKRRDFVNTISNNVWYNIVMTYDGSEDISGIKVYQNGVSLSVDNSGDFNGAFLGDIDSPGNLIIGNVDGGLLGGAFQGKYKDITLWDVSLNQSQITSIYNSGKPGNPRLQINDTNLKMWLRVDEDNIFHPTCRDSQSGTVATYVNIPKSDITTDVP